MKTNHPNFICAVSENGNWQIIPWENTPYFDKFFVFTEIEKPLHLPATQQAVSRIQGNSVIRKALDFTTHLNPNMDLNKLCMSEDIKRKDYSYLMQLISYSVDGYLGLSSTSNASYKDMHALDLLVEEGKVETDFSKGNVFLYQYQDGDKTILSDTYPEGIKPCDVQVFNNVAIPFPKLHKKGNKVVFKSNSAVVAIMNTLSKIVDIEKIEFSSHHYGIKAYTKEVKQEIVDMAEMFFQIKRINKARNAEVVLDSIIYELAKDNLEYAQALALKGQSLDYFSENVVLPTAFIKEIQRYGKLVA